MAAAFAPSGIRVNALAPGTVMTDMVMNNPPEAVESMQQAAFMRRGADPDEMVGPALLLCSDAGSFITGQALIADGGLTPLGVTPCGAASPVAESLLGRGGDLADQGLEVLEQVRLGVGVEGLLIPVVGELGAQRPPRLALVVLRVAQIGGGAEVAVVVLPGSPGD